MRLVTGFMFVGIFSNSPVLAVLGLASVLLNPLALAGFCQLSIRLGNWLRAIHDRRSLALALTLAALILAADAGVAIHLHRQSRARQDHAAEIEASRNNLRGTLAGVEIVIPSSPEFLIIYNRAPHNPRGDRRYVHLDRSAEGLADHGPDTDPAIEFYGIRLNGLRRSEWRVAGSLVSEGKRDQFCSRRPISPTPTGVSHARSTN